MIMQYRINKSFILSHYLKNFFLLCFYIKFFQNLENVETDYNCENNANCKDNEKETENYL